MCKDRDPFLETVLQIFAGFQRKNIIKTLILFVIFFVLAIFIFKIYPSLIMGCVSIIKSLFYFTITDGNYKELMKNTKEGWVRFAYAAVFLSFLVTAVTYLKLVGSWRAFLPINIWGYFSSIPPAVIFFIFIFYSLMPLYPRIFFYFSLFLALLYVIWDLLLAKAFNSRQKELKRAKCVDATTQKCEHIDSKIAYLDCKLRKRLGVTFVIDLIFLVLIPLVAFIPRLAQENDSDLGYNYSTAVCVLAQSIVYLVIVPETFSMQSDDLIAEC